MYNVALRRIRETILVVGKQHVLHICVRFCVRALMCACPGAWARACVEPCLSSKQRVCAILLRHLWHVWLHCIFRHCLINGTIFTILETRLKRKFATVNFMFCLLVHTARFWMSD